MLAFNTWQWLLGVPLLQWKPLSWNFWSLHLPLYQGQPWASKCGYRGALALMGIPDLCIRQVMHWCSVILWVTATSSQVKLFLVAAWRPSAVCKTWILSPQLSQCIDIRQKCFAPQDINKTICHEIYECSAYHQLHPWERHLDSSRSSWPSVFVLTWFSWQGPWQYSVSVVRAWLMSSTLSSVM